MLVVIAFCATLTVFLGILLWLFTIKFSHIPGDLGSPIFGNLCKVFKTFTWRGIDDMFRTTSAIMEKYGDTVVHWFGPVILISTRDPAVLEEMKSNPAAINKEYLLYKRIERIFVGSLTTSVTGQKFKEYKKRLMKTLSKFHLENYHEVFVNHSMDLIKFMKEQDGEFDVYQPVSLMTIDTILETHLGLPGLELKNKNFQLVMDEQKWIRDFSEENISPLTYLKSKSLFPLPEHLKCFHKMCLDEMLKRIQNRRIGKVLDNSTYGEELVLDGINKGMTQTEIDLELREIFYVGSHTSGVVISTAILFLAMYQDVQTKAWEEQVDILGDPNKSPSFYDLKHMNYLERVIREALRFCAPPVTTRRISQDINVGGLLLPKNSTVQILFYELLSNPKYWYNVNVFDPDHFLAENVSKRPAMAGQFFGLGPRNCPGAQYAMNEIKVVLSTVLRHCKLYTSLRHKDLQFHISFMNEIEGPYKVSVEPRVYKS